MKAFRRLKGASLVALLALWLGGIGAAQDRAVLLLDRSGSMGAAGPGGASGLDEAVRAAQLLVGLMPYGNYAGVVSFGSNVTVDLEPRLIQGVAERDLAWQALSGLSAGGGSLLGDGLEAARAALAALPPGTGSKSIILISDGDDRGSSNDPLLDVLPRLLADGVLCHSIAWDSGANLSLLQELAWQSGGSYCEAFDERSRPISLEDLATIVFPGVRIDRLDRDLNHGGVFSQEQVIDSQTGSLTFVAVASCACDVVSIELLSPSGRIYDEAWAATDPDVEYFALGAARTLRLENAESGVWVTRLRGVSIPGGTSWIRLDVARGSAERALVAESDAASYVQPHPALLTAWVDSTGSAVLGLSVRAEVVAPAGFAASVFLRDDGGALSGDVQAGDGIYSGRFLRWRASGRYRVLVRASATAATLQGGGNLGPLQRVAELHFDGAGTPASETGFLRIDALSALAVEGKPKRNVFKMDAAIDLDRQEGDPDVDDVTISVGGITIAVPAGTMERHADHYSLRGEDERVDLELYRRGSSLGQVRVQKGNFEPATFGNLEVVPIRVQIGAVDVSASVLPRLSARGTRAEWKRRKHERQDQQWILNALDLRSGGEGRDRLTLGMTMANILLDPTLDDLIVLVEDWGVVVPAGGWIGSGDRYRFDTAIGSERLRIDLDLRLGTVVMKGRGLTFGELSAPLTLGVAAGSYVRRMTIQTSNRRSRMRYGK